MGRAYKLVNSAPRLGIGALPFGISWCGVKTHKGFTLLEVLIAMAILAVSLLAIFETQGQAINMSNYAKNITVATLLARSKMLDIEAELKEEGFGTFEEKLEGDFEEEGFKKFRWVAEIKKVEIPISENLLGTKEGTEEGGTSILGFEVDPSMFAGNLQYVAELLSESMREVKLTVYWPEGSQEGNFSLTTHLVELGGAPVGIPGRLPGGISSRPGLPPRK